MSRLSVHSSSIVGSNVRILMDKLNLDTWDIVDGRTPLLNNKLHDMSEVHSSERVEMVRELCKMRDGTLECNLSNKEIGEILDIVCTE